MIDDMVLEYSFSDGKYWSKYDHCRVWKNGTYTVKVRDKYGQTTSSEILISNNHDGDINPPSLSSSYTERTWTDKEETVTVTTPDTSYIIEMSINNGTTWTNTAATGGTFTYTLGTKDGIQNVLFRCKDKYGNISSPVSFEVWRDSTAPTNINFVPEVSIANEIYTDVTVVASISPMTYSITYDNGDNWSEPQIGRKFGLVNNPPKGDYYVNCRAYNSTGKYVEGKAIKVTIK